MSALIHAQLPYEPPRDIDADIKHLRELTMKIVTLLRKHWIVVVGGQHAFMGSLDITNATAQAAIMDRLPDEPVEAGSDQSASAP